MTHCWFSLEIICIGWICSGLISSIIMAFIKCNLCYTPCFYMDSKSCLWGDFSWLRGNSILHTIIMRQWYITYEYHDAVVYYIQNMALSFWVLLPIGNRGNWHRWNPWQNFLLNWINVRSGQVASLLVAGGLVSSLTHGPLGDFNDILNE